MRHIHVSADAYWVLWDSCGTFLEPQRSMTGGYFIWLDDMTVTKLKGAREPGEGFSEAILRLAGLESTR
jgi:hypothetical protein